MQKTMNKYAVFILSHNRPNKVYTYNTLRKCGYTGCIYILIDDTDKYIEEYKKEFDNVIVFSKNDYLHTQDRGDNFGKTNVVLFARNANFHIAKQLGLTHFFQFDDDYTDFGYRTNHKQEYTYKSIRGLDKIFDALIKFYNTTSTTSIALAQGGDYIGGVDSQMATPQLKRKCMNTFLCSPDRAFTFPGTINEDVNAYVTYGAVGKLFFTITSLSCQQVQTQKSSGGMTDIYLDKGTYVKSFYSVMMAPSCVKVALMGNKDKRLHHRVIWKNAVPCILSPNYAKKISS